MENKMTPEVATFIEKAQQIARDLYEEFNSMDVIHCECKLTNFIDEMYVFSIENENELIK